MVLILDKAMTQIRKDNEIFCSRDIILIWYPTEHPYLNPVEVVWYVIKKKLYHSVRYASKTMQLKAFYIFMDNDPKLDYDFTKFWKQHPPKGVMRHIIRYEDKEDNSSIMARQVMCQPKKRKR